MFGRIKIRPADSLYSKWLREERKCCERCGSRNSLQVSHFYGRANEAVRFDPRNTDCLCFGCHAYFTANPPEYVAWKIKRMGDQEYKQLMVAANTYKKRDDAMVILWLNQLMKKESKEKPNKECVHRRKQCVLCHLKKKQERNIN